MLLRRNGFQKMDKIKDSNRQAKQLEDLTGKMKECKRYVKLNTTLESLIANLMYLFFHACTKVYIHMSSIVLTLFLI